MGDFEDYSFLNSGFDGGEQEASPGGEVAESPSSMQFTSSGAIPQVQQQRPASPPKPSASQLGYGWDLPGEQSMDLPREQSWDMPAERSMEPPAEQSMDFQPSDLQAPETSRPPSRPSPRPRIATPFRTAMQFRTQLSPQRRWLNPRTQHPQYSIIAPQMRRWMADLLLLSLLTGGRKVTR